VDPNDERAHKGTCAYSLAGRRPVSRAGVSESRHPARLFSTRQVLTCPSSDSKASWPWRGVTGSPKPGRLGVT
jgi:hypothetical protein